MLLLLLCGLAAAGEAEDAQLEARLLENPALLERKGAGLQTPLMAAVLSGDEGRVRLLLRLGADLLATEKDGYTPVHGAAFQGRSSILRLLHAAGADLRVPHSDGYLAFHRACWGYEQRHADTVRAFLELDPGLLEEPARGGATCRKMSKSPLVHAVLDEYSGRKKDL